MKHSLVGPVIAFGGLAGCARDTLDSPMAGHRTTWDLLALLVVGLILFAALTGVLAVLARRGPSTGSSFDLASGRVRPRRAPAHRRDRLVRSGREPDRGIG